MSLLCITSSSPFESRHLLWRLLLELGQRAVLLKALVVQQLAHGNVGQLLSQLEGLVDVEEDREDVLVDAGAHLDCIGQQESGAFFQLGDICPAHHQFGWMSRDRYMSNERLMRLLMVETLSEQTLHPEMVQ